VVRRGRGGDRRQRGAVAVEFALVLPLLMLLVLAGIDWGYFFFVSQVAANAAREGARAGSLVPQPPIFDAALPCAGTATSVGATAAALDYLQRGRLIANSADMRLRSITCTVAPMAGFTDPQVVTVTVTYQARPASNSMSLTGYLSSALLPRAAVATAAMRVEP
jgi:Flp pilus assembly protein TadG